MGNDPNEIPRREKVEESDGPNATIKIKENVIALVKRGESS